MIVEDGRYNELIVKKTRELSYELLHGRLDQLIEELLKEDIELDDPELAALQIMASATATVKMHIVDALKSTGDEVTLRREDGEPVE